MATTVYNVEEVELQDGSKVKLKPLSVKELRRFMASLQSRGEVTDEQSLDVMIDACAIALERQLPDLVKDKDALELALDVPTMNRIFEVCAGIKLDDPNLLAAVLAGQNSI